MTIISPAALVPGGILETDHWHIVHDDGTCSRCRTEPPEDDVPILMWRNDGRDMLRYCETCCAGGKRGEVHGGWPHEDSE